MDKLNGIARHTLGNERPAVTIDTPATQQSDASAPSLGVGERQVYRDDGLVVPAYRLPAAQLAMLRDALDRLIADNPGVRPEQLISAHIARGGGERVKGSDVFLEFAHDRAILDLVECVIGGDIILWGCQVFCKPAGDGMEVPWHQDGRYWPIRPLATCTVWVALDASTPENGCMRYVPGSHSGHIYRHRHDDRADLALDLVLEDDAIDASAGRDVVLQAGQMSMHDVFLVHGSAPNRSAQRRAGLAIRYMPSTSHFDRAIVPRTQHATGHVVSFAQRPLWLVRGVDRGGNDFTVGHAR
jgi:ectoine hydroxylase-related dioxygenase (phytanoyl-CoA dioxygenase family)